VVQVINCEYWVVMSLACDFNDMVGIKEA